MENTKPEVKLPELPSDATVSAIEHYLSRGDIDITKNLMQEYGVKCCYEAGLAAGRGQERCVVEWSGDELDRLAAQAMDKIALDRGMHALDLNPNITDHHTLRRALVQAGISEALKQSLARPAQNNVSPAVEKAMVRFYDKLAEVKAAQQPAQAVVPEGWKLVPIEPTMEMVRQGLRSLHENDRDESAIQCYRYMLNAAPDSVEGL